MRKLLFLYVLLVLFSPKVFGDTKTSSMTVTVGQTFTINPVTLCGFSTSKALSGTATFPNTDGLAVSPSTKSVTIAGSGDKALKGSYITYTVTALKVLTLSIFQI